MLGYLKQSTASQTRTVGPFVDDTDFKTLETGLTINNTDVKLSANGGAAANKNSGGGTHVANGEYSLTFDATDTATVGELSGTISVSGALVVRFKFVVLEEAVYDALFAASAGGFASVAALATAQTDLDTLTGSDGVTLATSQPNYVPATAAALATVDTNVDAILVDTGTDIPASIAGIGTAGGAALQVDAATSNEGGGIPGVTSATTLVGTVTGNTYTATSVLDGTNHQITSDGSSNITIVYQFLTGGGTSPVSLTWTGYLTSSNDSATISAWNHVGGAWEQVGSISGTNGTTNSVVNPVLYARHVGTSAAELGKVYVRILSTGGSSPVLNTDQLYVSYAVTSRTVGYANGSIWVDTNNGTAGTSSFVNGVADNPVLTWADALTLSAALGITRFTLISGSSITLTASCDNYFFDAPESTIALNGQSIEGAYFFGATVSGTDDGAQTTPARFIDCRLGPLTLAGGGFGRCALTDTITLSAATTYLFDACFSGIAGSATPTIDFGAAVGSTSLNMRHYSGGIEIENMGGAGTDTMSLEGDGQLVINANCSGGTIAIRGNFRFTDNSGSVGLVPTLPNADQVDQGTAQGAGTGNNQIQLASTASTTNGQYDPAIVTIIAGTGAGQSRLILEYVGATRTATVDKDWRTNPDSTSVYVVQATGGLNHVNEGLATGGASTTITLNSAASSTDSIYVGQTVFVVSGTGQDQSRIVTAYNGTTKVATVHRAWDTTPDTTSAYLMLPLPTIGDTVADWADGGRLDLILDAVPTAAQNASTLLASTADGVAVSEILRQLLALGVGGKFTYDANTGVLERFAQDGTTSLGSITLTATGGTPV